MNYLAEFEWEHDNCLNGSVELQFNITFTWRTNVDDDVMVRRLVASVLHFFLRMQDCPDNEQQA